MLERLHAEMNPQAKGVLRVADNNRSAEEAVRVWLNKTGYPFQMQVGHSIAQLMGTCPGIWVLQGETFDQGDGTQCEVDVVADMTCSIGGGRSISVLFVIECKKTVNPWVLFRDVSDVDSSLHDQFLPVVQELSESSSLEGVEFRELLLEKCSLLTEGTPYGYSVAEAFRDKSGSDPAYDAVRQVSRCVRAVLRQGLDSHTGSTGDMKFVLPCVLVSGPVFTAHLDDAGDLLLERPIIARLKVTNPLDQDRSNHIFLVEASGLERLITAIQQAYGVVGEFEDRQKL